MVEEKFFLMAHEREKRRKSYSQNWSILLWMSVLCAIVLIIYILIQTILRVLWEPTFHFATHKNKFRV